MTEFSTRSASISVEGKVAVGPRQACQLLDIGTTHLYELLAAHELRSYTDGRRRKILVASILEYIERRLAAADGR